MLRFEIYREGGGGSRLGDMISGTKGTWRWRLWSNSDIIAHGEDYQNKADCLNAINSVMATTASTPVKEV